MAALHRSTQRHQFKKNYHEINSRSNSNYSNNNNNSKNNSNNKFKMKKLKK